MTASGSNNSPWTRTGRVLLLALLALTLLVSLLLLLPLRAVHAHGILVSRRMVSHKLAYRDTTGFPRTVSQASNFPLVEPTGVWFSSRLAPYKACWRSVLLSSLVHHLGTGEL